MLKAKKCISRARSGIPRWLDDYFRLMVAAFPFHIFNLIEFQRTWVQHLRECECNLLPETFYTIWAAMNTVIRESMEKAGSYLSIGLTQCEAHIVSPTPTTPLSLPEGMDVSQADVIVRSSDHVDFRVHKSILACSSLLFDEIFSLPQPSDKEAVDGLPIVKLAEDAEIVRALITTLYPIPSELPTSYDRILALLASAQKYDMGAVQSSIRAEVSRRNLSTFNRSQVFRIYAMASKGRLIPEMNMAARLSLDLPMTFEYLGVELRLFEGWALRALLNFRINYRDNLISCFKLFVDTSTGPSKIWNTCPELKLRLSTIVPGSIFSSMLSVCAQGIKHSPSVPGPPAWLHNVFSFSKEIGDPLWSPTDPFVGPSDIREKYLSAMQEHVTADKCTSCLEVHAMKGEKYIVEVERAVTQARDMTTLDVS
ncbi:hypothetical protein EI94DRAFT_663604 [Lactarius quietus]|nr:hypothetical protein EI94DRAFT_663604 [Lactarius quietus]